MIKQTKRAFISETSDREFPPVILKDLDSDDIADYIWKMLKTKAAESDYDITSTLSLSTHHLKEETFQKLLWEPLQNNLGLSVYVTDEAIHRPGNL